MKRYLTTVWDNEDQELYFVVWESLPEDFEAIRKWREGYRTYVEIPFRAYVPGSMQLEKHSLNIRAFQSIGLVADPSQALPAWLGTTWDELKSIADDDEELVENSAGRLGLMLGPADRDLVATSDDAGKREGILHLSQVRVAFTEQLHHEVVARYAHANVSGGCAGHRRGSSPVEDSM